MEYFTLVLTCTMKYMNIYTHSYIYMNKFWKMALIINQGSGQLGFFLAREAKELAHSMALAYDAASTIDSYNSRLDQSIYAPILCPSSSVRDILNWLYSGVRAMTDPRANIFTSQMTEMKPVSNFPAMSTTTSSCNLHWTVAGAHEVIIADDTQIVIRAMSAGVVSTLLFSLDWANYILQPTEVDGIDLGLVNESGRNMPANSSRAYGIGDILSARYFLSPMGCASRSLHLLRLGKIKVINKFGFNLTKT